MLGVRPSELYNITFPLARYYFDVGILKWGQWVENKLNEAEAGVRRSMQNRSGVEAFATSARISMHNKIFGFDNSSAFASAGIDLGDKKEEKKSVELKSISGEEFSLEMLN